MADWAALEFDYALGEKSVGELAHEYGVSEAEIETRAIEDGWPCEGVHALDLARSKFVEAYVGSLNVSAAASMAGVSEETGRKWMQSKPVRRAINARLREARIRSNLSIDKIIARYSSIAFGDPGRFFNDDGSPKAMGDLNEDDRAMLAALEIVEGKDANGGTLLLQTRKLKFHDALGALRDLAKLQGAMEERVHVSADVKASINTDNVTDNEVARRLAFLLLQATKQQGEKP